MTKIMKNNAFAALHHWESGEGPPVCDCIVWPFFGRILAPLRTVVQLYAEKCRKVIIIGLQGIYHLHSRNR
jgi:hypothetical protein